MYTQFGQSLLHQSIRYQNHDAFEILMQDGANPCVCDQYGETPLMAAVIWHDFKAIKRLIAH
ncbi:hypothetical protein T484DRAFT_1650704, partial [Baffinella frigidus]